MFFFRWNTPIHINLTKDFYKKKKAKGAFRWYVSFDLCYSSTCKNIICHLLMSLSVVLIKFTLKWLQVITM